MLNKKRPFNIQLFAEGDGDKGQGAEGATESTQDEQKQTGIEGTHGTDETKTEEKKFTDKDLQSFADKRVTDALKKSEEKYQQQIDDLNRKIEMSKLSEKERVEAEKKHREEELQQREKAIAEKQLQLDTVTWFNENKVPHEYLEIVQPIGDLEGRQKAVGTINKIVEEQVNARVKEMEKGSFTGSRGTGEPIPNNPKEALGKIFGK